MNVKPIKTSCPKIEARELLSGWQRNGKPWFDEKTLNLLDIFIKTHLEQQLEKKFNKNMLDWMDEQLSKRLIIREKLTDKEQITNIKLSIWDFLAHFKKNYLKHDKDTLLVKDRP